MTYISYKVGHNPVPKVAARIFLTTFTYSLNRNKVKTMKRILIYIRDNIVPSIVLAILFFAVRDYATSRPNLYGCWIVVENTLFSDKNTDLINANVLYRAYVQNANFSIDGTSEKIWETSQVGTEEHEGDDRRRSEIEGYVHKRYIPWVSDRINFHIINKASEYEDIRESTTLHDIKRKNDSTMVGTFLTSAADSKGKATWLRCSPSLNSYTKILARVKEVHGR